MLYVSIGKVYVTCNLNWTWLIQIVAVIQY